jgi:hypothetical protein
MEQHRTQQTSPLLTQLTDSLLHSLFVLEFILLCAIVLYNSEIFDVILDGIFETLKILFRYTDKAAVAYLIARGKTMQEREIHYDGGRSTGSRSDSQGSDE